MHLGRDGPSTPAQRDYERTPVVRIALTGDQRATFQSVQNARKSRAAVSEPFVQVGDARRPALVQVREDVRFRLGDVELRIGRQRERDGVRGPMELGNEV